MSKIIGAGNIAADWGIGWRGDLVNFLALLSVVPCPEVPECTWKYDFLGRIPSVHIVSSFWEEKAKAAYSRLGNDTEESSFR